MQRDKKRWGSRGDKQDHGSYQTLLNTKREQEAGEKGPFIFESLFVNLVSSPQRPGNAAE